MRTHLSTEADVRSALEKERKGTIHDEVWQTLVEDGYVEPVLIGLIDEDWDDLVQAARREEKRFRRYVTSAHQSGQAEERHERRDPGQSSHHRTTAVEALLAAEANLLPAVKRFRREVLDDQLLAQAAIPGWVQAQAECDGPSTRYVTLAVPPDQDVRLDTGEPIHLSGQPVEVRQRDLAYPGPDNYVHRVFVNKDGVLGRLEQLVGGLAKRFSWQPSLATAFVLTGEVPSARHVVSTTHLRWPYQAACSRVSLEVVPWATSDQVADAYRQGKTRLSADLGPLGPVTKKWAWLIDFICARLNGSDIPPQGWATLCEEWNVAYPEWAFQSWRRLASDFRRAQTALLWGQPRSDPGTGQHSPTIGDVTADRNLDRNAR